ncbi:MAG: hypothetical protein P1V51_15010 [Deltaproteobacteria bacterium]|nr:hypothetical protein [Deltaproteobacteria bacterium]
MRTLAALLAFLPGAALANPPSDAPAGPAAAAAAPRRAHTLSFGWSPRFMARHDEIFSPRTTRGASALGLTLGHSWEGPRLSHHTRVDFSMAQASTQPAYEYLMWPRGEVYTTTPTPFTFVRVDHAALRRVELPGRLTLHLGGAVDLDFQQFDWVWHPFALGGYAGIFGLDARAELEADLGARHRLRLGLSTPLLAWVARSPYSVTDTQLIWNNRENDPFRTIFRYIAGGTLRTLNQHQALRMQVTYGYQVTPRLGLSLTAHGRVNHLTVPRPLLAQEWGLTLATRYAF